MLSTIQPYIDLVHLTLICNVMMETTSYLEYEYFSFGEFQLSTYDVRSW